MNTNTYENKDTYDYETEHTYHRNNAAKPILGGFLVGSVIGVAAALLFAPRPGVETRATIRNKAVDLRDRTSETVRDTVSQARNKASELKDTVRGKAEELTHRGKNITSETLDDISRTTETGYRGTGTQNY